MVQVSKKGAIPIPREIRERYGIRPGDKIEFVDSERVIWLIPVPREEPDAQPRKES